MTATDNILDVRRERPSLRFDENLKIVFEEYGKSYRDQLLEILRLKLGPGKIDPYEYYMYGLYDDEKYTMEEKFSFLGHKMMVSLARKYFKRANATETTDKIVFYGRLAKIGVPTPKTYAVYIRKAGKLPSQGVELINSNDSLANYVRHRVPYPFFSKPATQAMSLGIAAVDSYEPESDSIVLAGGRSVSVDRYVGEVQHYGKTGYLFQERLEPHPSIEQLCGRRICTARALVIMERGVPTLLRASLKIPCGANQADNFWREGNILGGLDIETGEVVRAIDRGHPGQIEIEVHPDTSARIKGFVAPDWPRVKALCLKVARAFPDSPVQGWDIAFCADGPRALEVEGYGGHPMMTQLPLGQGLLDDRFKTHLESYMR